MRISFQNSTLISHYSLIPKDSSMTNLEHGEWRRTTAENTWDASVLRLWSAPTVLSSGADTTFEPRAMLRCYFENSHWKSEYYARRHWRELNSSQCYVKSVRTMLHRQRIDCWKRYCHRCNVPYRPFSNYWRPIEDSRIHLHLWLHVYRIQRVHWSKFYNSKW